MAKKILNETGTTFEDERRTAEEAPKREIEEARAAAEGGTDTSTCANCERDSVYVDDQPGVNPVGFCATHLPRHLREKAKNEVS